MVGFSTPFGGDDGGSDALFDSYDEFVPANVPEPGRFLEGHDVLTGEAHLDFHELTRDLFEERGVYDMTFGYNLARLNLDTRHRNAGYRYAVERGSTSPPSQAREDAEDPSILWAEFTPTTPFCPQSDTLTRGSFRAWNGLADRHEYDLVRVRVDEMHHRADAINEMLAEMEAAADDGETGESSEQRQRGSGGTGCSQGMGGTSRGYSADAPF
ncbi:hypothetical protein SAMN05216559_3733 [Halomicrobium zhouii]|uniref:DUF7998 domain-containing protein n=1 Tax=Halomicrobium zhouii TaxID=767519 RepID=A0A1I6M440_9EURY|nr:hypothetical protein [Halomicrobium zhouii]SFS10450.1 hypothetical protein SAMN05216559_3733 [Halomicrobium zhouii]